MSIFLENLGESGNAKIVWEKSGRKQKVCEGLV